MTSTVVFRAIGSVQVGTGHLRHMGLVAKGLADLGYKTVLCCNPEAPIIYPEIYRDFTDHKKAETEIDFINFLRQYSRENCIKACVFDHYTLEKKYTGFIGNSYHY